MNGLFNKKVETKDGVMILIAFAIIMMAGILLTDVGFIFGAGAGDANTLDGMDWDGSDCSGVECNIKDYIDAKSVPCTADNSGQCYISEALKSGLDLELIAGNIRNGVDVFGVVGSYAGPVYTDCTADNGGTCYLSQASKSALDVDLVTGNIKSGVNIFGIAGDTNVVNTSAGTLTSNAQLLSGYIGFSDGNQYTGSLTNCSGTAGQQTCYAGASGEWHDNECSDSTTTTQAECFVDDTAKYVDSNACVNSADTGYCYMNTATFSAMDTDLVAGNIKSGTTIFGVAGTLSVVSTSLFPGSSIALGNDETLVQGWLGGGKTGTLCYDSTTNGMSASTFHSLCDSQGPTLTLIKVSDTGQVIGGYNSNSWDSSSGWLNSSTNFLYNLTYDYKLSLSVYPQYGSYNTNSYGPTFGGGHDLYTGMPGSGYNNAHSYQSPSTYGYTYLAGAYSWTSAEVEVYKISSGGSLFPGSSIVSGNDETLVQGWLGGSKTGTLCYDSNTNGMSASTFHSACDNQGPTLTLIKVNNGQVVGGYNSNSWDSSSGYKNSSTNFLYNLTHDYKLSIASYPEYSTYNSSSYGPTFGGGHDLYNAMPSGYNSTHSYQNPATYGYSYLADASSWSATEIEVYKVQ